MADQTPSPRAETQGYAHAMQLAAHLIPRSCVMVVLVEDPTDGGAMRAIVSGSPSMEPFDLLDQLTEGLLLLQRAIRQMPHGEPPAPSRIVSPNGSVPPFDRTRG